MIRKGIWGLVLVLLIGTTVFVTKAVFSVPKPSVVTQVAVKPSIHCQNCASDSKATVEFFFVPGDDPEGRILDAIADAKYEILMQSFLFTNRNISKALIKAHKRGVVVEVINDKTAFKTKQAPVIPALVAAGIPGYIWMAITAPLITRL